MNDAEDRLSDLSSGSDRDQRRRFAALTGEVKAAPPKGQDAQPVRVATFQI